MQNWSWWDPGQSPRPPPGLTPHPPAPTQFTLRSSSRKNSCKRGSPWKWQLAPGEGRASRAPSGGLYLALALPFVWLMRFLCFFGTVPFQRSSFVFYNSVVLVAGTVGQMFIRRLSLLTLLSKLRRPCGKKRPSRLSCRSATRQSHTFTAIRITVPTPHMDRLISLCLKIKNAFFSLL